MGAKISAVLNFLQVCPSVHHIFFQESQSDTHNIASNYYKAIQKEGEDNMTKNIISKSNISEEYLTNENISEQNISADNIRQDFIAEDNITETNIADYKIAERNIIEESIEEATPHSEVCNTVVNELEQDADVRRMDYLLCFPLQKTFR